jgi:heme a synthase
MAVADYSIDLLAEGRTAATLTPVGRSSAVSPMRLYFLVLSAASLIAFGFGVENRLTSDGLFNVPPDVDWLPPFSAQDWFAAFTRHQQDPAFSACGGTESLAEFKTLYWWAWGRQASLLVVAGVAALGFVGGCLLRDFRGVLPRLAGLLAAVFAFWIAHAFVDVMVVKVEVLSSFNVGQYHRAVDLMSASAIVAGVVASAAVPPGAFAQEHRRAHDQTEWLWFGFILLDICFGALFAARGATAVWPTWPGYEGGVLPPLDRLFSYTPLWLNFTFNQYMIQLVHRTLSAGLFIAALWSLIVAYRRSVSVELAATRLILLAAQMLTGIAALMLETPAMLSLAHQVGSLFLLACPLSALFSRNGASIAPIRA